MLVLSRKYQEVIIIDTGQELIEVHVTAFNRVKVKLGFIAPDSIKIHRKEVYDAIRLKNQGRKLFSDNPCDNGDSQFDT